MEKMNMLCFTIMLIGCFSEVISESNSATDLWKRHSEAAQKLPKLFRRDEDEYDQCKSALMCITDFNLIIAHGDISRGLFFSTSRFNEICKMANEYLTCYEYAALEFECGFQSTLYANLSRAALTSFCEMPGKSELPSLVECFNKRYIQTFVYGESRETYGKWLAYDEVNMNAEEKREKVCRSEGEMIYRSMDEIGVMCGSDELTFLCNILSDTTTMVAISSILGGEICPAEIYR
ncbi:hypothetical protein KP79_PYT11173 [Mizuhopecten yessoensis]|uniref:Uncharacterized protein n=1 Tax=Mizuhopecten yessoensis TaxID=6573 RepID=A0A210R447_MIZYE|nr:hypothetical protein KP79_PYT11173 [Mizuhopecten yessoensis]